MLNHSKKKKTKTTKLVSIKTHPSFSPHFPYSWLRHLLISFLSLVELTVLDIYRNEIMKLVGFWQFLSCSIMSWRFIHVVADVSISLHFIADSYYSIVYFIILFLFNSWTVIWVVSTFWLLWLMLLCMCSTCIVFCMSMYFYFSWISGKSYGDSVFNILRCRQAVFYHVSLPPAV